MTEKIKTNPDEIVSVVQEHNISRRRPNSGPEIARLVSARHGHPYWHYKNVDMGAVNKALALMVSDGTLILRTGKEWKGVSLSTYGFNPEHRYYALASDVKVWEDGNARRDHLALVEQARSKALEDLRERHREEFQELEAGHLFQLTLAEAVQ
ncbi:hypothetical protein [Streptomyces sp. NPDC059278]|uniref:hypothetical protein n=1 Tax=Streptomyces sp. NPDC059278 TaxID=3346801 RepID=UPI0036B1B420